MLTAMKISGDCSALNPQPLPHLVKSKALNPKDELVLNKSKLVELKEQMKFLRERIKKFSEILQKEVGDNVDIKELLRYGSSHGWQGRSQMIVTLRLKLIAMRSKFLDPPHKMYYVGPFDPKKEFDLKCLPKKQENLYQRMLEEKKKDILRFDKPIAVLQKEFDELSLMHRAARFRTKNLTSIVKSTRLELEKRKQEAEFEHRVVEAMMAHQSLYKMMVDPETFRLDPTLKKHKKLNPLDIPKVSDWSKFKMRFDKTKKEKICIQEKIDSLVTKLDQINRKLIEVKQVEIQTQLHFENQKIPEVTSGKEKNQKDKEKLQSDSEKEYKLLVQENHVLSQYLFTTVLTTEDDFRLFQNSLNAAEQEFVNVLKN